MSLELKLIRHGAVNLVSSLLLIFGPARTWNYWQAWTYLFTTSFAGLLTVLYFYKHDPEFLERRLLPREQTLSQKIIITSLRLVVALGFAFCGADHRFGWSQRFFPPAPAWLTCVSLGVVLAAQISFLWVGRANCFAASIIRIESGQTVAHAGPYSYVRHPMYSGFIVTWLFTPLALGSFAALPVFALAIPIVVARLLNEETILKRELPNYLDYCTRTRWRLVPSLW